MPATLSRPAHAKINLCLSVGPPQPPAAIHEGKDVSGFHKVASWMVCIDLHDEVTITRKPDGDFSTCQIKWAADAPRPTPIDWSLTQDLSWRGHGALEKHVGRLLPIDLVLTKRVPVGSGLGGGSSDAATTLILLNELFELNLSAHELQKIAFSLGSDVAFFIDSPDPDSEPTDEPFLHPQSPRAALVSSFGEIIERADPVQSAVILIIPPFSCATKDVYRAFDELQALTVESKRAQIAVHKGQEAADLYQPQDARDDLIVRRIEKSLRAADIDSDSLFNDLFLPAIHVQPRLGRLTTALSRATRTPAHLTGSGSALFLLSGPGKVDKLLAKVRKTLDSLASISDDSTAAHTTSEPTIALATRLL